MVLSGEGRSAMTKLSDTQAVILSTASQREDGAVLPLPETLKIKGGALDKVLGSLKAKGLIDQQGTPRGDDLPPLCITRAGLEAIGVESEDGAGPATAEASTPEAPEAEAQAKPAKHKAKEARPNKAAPANKPTPRAGTKQAQMIELLKRPEGATVEQIAAATGWQHHTIRGAISGALEKKLGLKVETTRTREVGPDKAGAKEQHGLPGRRLRERPMIIERPRRRGHQLHAPDSDEAEVLLTERGLTRADLDRAIAELERTEGIAIRTIVGINDDGVFGTRRAGWHPDLPDATPSRSCRCSGQEVWLQILELLGRVPRGSTARFLEIGMLPADA